MLCELRKGETDLCICSFTFRPFSLYCSLAVSCISHSVFSDIWTEMCLVWRKKKSEATEMMKYKIEVRPSDTHKRLFELVEIGDHHE